MMDFPFIRNSLSIRTGMEKLMSGSAPGGGVAPGIPGALPGTFWCPAPGLPGQPPSGTMVIELDPMDREFQMVRTRRVHSFTDDFMFVKGLVNY